MHRWVDRLAARRFLANGSFVRQQTVVMVNDTMYPSPGRYRESLCSAIASE